MSALTKTNQDRQQGRDLRWLLIAVVLLIFLLTCCASGIIIEILRPNYQSMQLNLLSQDKADYSPWKVLLNIAGVPQDVPRAIAAERITATAAALSRTGTPQSIANIPTSELSEVPPPLNAPTTTPVSVVLFEPPTATPRSVGPTATQNITTPAPLSNTSTPVQVAQNQSPTPLVDTTATPTPTSSQGSSATPTPTSGSGATPSPTAVEGSTPTPTSGSGSTPTPTSGLGSTPTPTSGSGSTPTPTSGSGSTPTPTATRTPTPSLLTSTPTLIQPTATNTAVAATATNTAVPPTATATNTAVPPTATNTAVAATATNTAVPPTVTATNTAVPPTATATNTAVPPTATATNTAVPPTATDTPTATATDTPTATPTPPSGSLTISQSLTGPVQVNAGTTTYIVTIRNDTNGPVTISSVNMSISIQPSGGLGFGGFNLATCNASAGGNGCSFTSGDPATIVWNASPSVPLAVGETLTITITGGFAGVLGPPPIQGCAAITGGSTTPSFTLNQTGPCVGITP